MNEMVSEKQTSEYQVGSNGAFYGGIRANVNELLCPVLVTALGRYV